MEENEEKKKKTASPFFQETVSDSAEDFSKKPFKKQRLPFSTGPEISGISKTNDYNRELNLKKINDAIEFPKLRELKKTTNPRFSKKEKRQCNSSEKFEEKNEVKTIDKAKTIFCQDCNGLLVLGKCTKCGKNWDYTGIKRKITVNKAPEAKERKIGGETK